MTDEKVLDINKLISNIKGMLCDKTIKNERDSKYYGKITICFENGEFKHIERYETMR